MNFGCKTFTGKIYCNNIGTSIGMPVYSGNEFFENSGHMIQRVPGKMLDQKY